MNRVDGIEINIYWSDLTEKAKEDILYRLSVAGISLSTLIKNDMKPFAWKGIDKDGDGIMTEQMKIFRKMLDDRGIKWEDASEENSVLPITRTHFLYKNIEWSVIHGFGTYGGWNHHESDKGLLEIWDHDSEPIGWLTAKEAMDTIEEANHEP